MRRVASHRVKGTVLLKSGLRIGGGEELLEIGASDLACIKHPVSLKPYIPGSALKGKMRCELERAFGLFGGNGEPFAARKHPGELSENEYLLGAIFGPHRNPKHELGPSRLVVRDSLPLENGDPGNAVIEVKSENAVNRKTGIAEQPRTVERVVAGSRFALELVVQIWDIDLSSPKARFNGVEGGNALLEFVKEGLKQIEQTGLGSGVSRGSGWVEFTDLSVDGAPFSLR